jgi:hypothetical protein
VLTKTDEGADSVYKNMTTFLVEKEPGFGETAQGVTIPGKIDKMGYKGVETTELILEGTGSRADQILGGTPARGFYQMMDGVEVGRVNVAPAPAASPTGPSSWHRLRPAARDLRQADRRAPGDPVPAGRDGHQGRGRARHDGPRCPLKDTGERNDVEAGMAKMVARSTATRSSRTPSGSTAATATPRSTRSSASTARCVHADR